MSILIDCNETNAAVRSAPLDSSAPSRANDYNSLPAGELLALVTQWHLHLNPKHSLLVRIAVWWKVYTLSLWQTRVCNPVFAYSFPRIRSSYSSDKHRSVLDLLDLLMSPAAPPLIGQAGAASTQFLPLVLHETRLLVFR